VRDARAIVAELKKYDPGLHAKPRGLVLNKLDLLPANEREGRTRAFVKSLRWKGPVFAIAAISGEGCRELVFATQAWLDEHVAVVAASEAQPDAVPQVVSPAPVRRRRRAAKEA
jgi:GTP-binding protein